jgi:hypothetical protein
MEITEEMIRDATSFSNFAQRVKMDYWNKLKTGEFVVAERYLDDILLLAWKDFKQYGKNI